ncbi:MAG TPA: hypothetical protein DDW27_00135 [Bacteroidales bacterium]|nr:hypothetical protein [Bacteroidales bacterium]
MNKMVTRTEFLKGIVRIMMAGLLAFIALSLGKRIVKEQDCSGCPGRGVCRGEVDCEGYRRKTDRK